MGNRNMQLFPITISIMASFISAILILGTPAEMYTAGTLYMFYIIGACIGCIVAAMWFVPLLYPLKLTSSYEYLEKRFQANSVKLIATGICIIQQVLYMGIASYAPSTALSAVSEFPEGATILIVGLVATVYTCLGGIKAVVWSDVFQAGVMIAGLLAIVIQGTLTVGGIQHVWEVNKKWGRIRFNEFHFDPTIRHTFWNLLCGAGVGWMAIFGISQASVQRFSALPTLKQARHAILLNIIVVSAIIFLACVAGITVFAYYATKGCDPLSSQQIQNANQIIPLFVGEVLGYPGLPGLFIAGLFSGALSSVSSSLNGLAAVTWDAFLKGPCQNLSEAKKALVTKILVLIFGAAGVGFGFIARKFGGTVLQASLSFTGASGGPMTGLFILGAFFPMANWKGAVAGGTLGLILPLWISFGAYYYGSYKTYLPLPTETCNATVLSDILEPNSTLTPTDSSKFPELMKLYSLSYLWYSSVGIVGCVSIGLIVSFITGPSKKKDINPDYLVPLMDRLCCCFPFFLRRKMQCCKYLRSKRQVSKPENDATLKKEDMQVSTDVSLSLNTTSQNDARTGLAFANIAFHSDVRHANVNNCA